MSVAAPSRVVFDRISVNPFQRVLPCIVTPSFITFSSFLLSSSCLSYSTTSSALLPFTSIFSVQLLFGFTLFHPFLASSHPLLPFTFPYPAPNCPVPPHFICLVLTYFCHFSSVFTCPYLTNIIFTPAPLFYFFPFTFHYPSVLIKILHFKQVINTKQYCG